MTLDEAPRADDDLGRGATIGRYTILAPVGRGGMGQVYAAYDPHLDRKVALKLMHASHRGDPQRAQARLIREAKALAKLSHHNVVAVHDAGAFQGRVFVAMTFVDGVTLKDWLAERPRTQQQILDVFASAARGLGAAHAAGLVHRDFKPSNVMIGNDGTVRVTDFGLARVIDDTGADAFDTPVDAAPRDLHLTHTGERLGTPLYMAPEQFVGGATDPRTDQFSFCVALYQALYGAAPFGRSAFDAHMKRVLSGRVEPAPPRTTVPVWLRRVLLRGLSVTPAARWPSMSELVTALGRDPTRTRRRWGLAAGVSLLVVMSAVTLARGTKPVQLCLGGPARLAGVWESAGPRGAEHARRAAVEQAFLATGAPGAREVWERASVLLDRYGARWLAMYRDACEATHVRHEQTDAVLELRMTCLDERRLALSALTGILATADRTVVSRSVDAANALPAIDRCGDLKELEAPVERPPDELTRRRVEDLRGRAAIAKALHDTGRHKEARETSRAQLTEARALKYPPLVAEMLIALDRTYLASNFRPEAIPLSEEAVWSALSVGRDDLAAEAAGTLVGHLAFLGRYDEARAWLTAANAILRRAGEGHEILQAWLLTDEAGIDTYQNRGAEALELMKRAVALKERNLPPDHPDIARSLNNEAEALAQMGRADEALPLNDRVHDLFVRAYGPASTDVAYALSNRGEYFIALGRPAEALDPLRRALTVWEAQIGAEDYLLGFPLTALGRALIALGRAQEALPPLERALRLREAHPVNATLVAETRFALARALWDANADRARARALASLAHAAYVGAADEKNAADITAWLAAHGDAKPTR